MRILVTGPPGIGKTTVVLRASGILRSMGYAVGGMVTREVRRGGRRVGFEVVDLETGARGWLALAEPGSPRVGRYHVRVGEFEEIGVAALIRATRSADVVVCDEIGPMELHSERFIEAVKSVYEGGKPVIGVVHQRSRHPLVVWVKGRSTVVEVTLRNRDDLPKLIASRISDYLGRHDRV